MSWRPKPQEEIVQSARLYNYVIYINLSTIEQVLTITVTDSITTNQWKNIFSQTNFDNIKNKKINLYKVTKTVLDALKSSVINQRCKIIVHSNYCYLTIDSGTVLPSFALPLITYSNNLLNQNYSNYSNYRNYRNYNKGGRNRRNRAITTNSLNTMHQKQNTFYKNNIQKQIQSQKIQSQPQAPPPPPPELPQPPPVTLDMLVSYSKHNLLMIDQTTNSINTMIDETNKHRPPPPKPKTRQSSQSVYLPPPPPRVKKGKSLNELELNNNPSSDTDDSESSDNDDNKSSNIIHQNDNDNDKYQQLVTIYNGYVNDNNEAPSNSFDLINYMQFNGVKGMNFKEVGKFLMNYKYKQKM